MLEKNNPQVVQINDKFTAHTWRWLYEHENRKDKSVSWSDAALVKDWESKAQNVVPLPVYALTQETTSE